MMNAPFEKEFIFHDGERAKNILELRHKIVRMSDLEFSTFVNEQKNDFANWIEYVLSDRELASRLRTTIHKESALKMMEQKIAEHNAQESFVKITKESLKEEKNEEKRSAIPTHESRESRDSKEEHHQKKKLHERIKNKWYEWVAKKRDLQKVQNEVIRIKHDEKQFAAQEDLRHSEQLFWIILYGVLIILIIALLVYKFAFM